VNRCFAKRKGVKTLGLVRRVEAMSAAREAGCELVLPDDDIAPRKMAEALGEKRMQLALDAVGGEATGRLATLLGPRGTLVSYAAPSFAAMAVSPFEVIFNDLTVRGFSPGNPDFAGQIPGAIMQAARMVASGIAIPLAATYRLEEIGAAIAHQARGGKGAPVKVLASSEIGRVSSPRVELGPSSNFRVRPVILLFVSA
jgi:NADPH:quinone reductase-like Zn-dependent oxidoreductase